jgi:hypothetical protein
MTSAQSGGPGDEWRLGVELGEPHEYRAGEAAREPTPDLSVDRLERPLQVVTVEHLGWLLIALWAAVTRLVVLGARPLSAAEARNALFEFDLTNKTSSAAAAGFHAAWAGWVHLLEAGIFAIVGAGDLTARVIFALSGLLLVAMAFEMRHYVGRAGGLSLGAMFAISPTATYFGRSSATVTPALALALATISVFMALECYPRRRLALELGGVAGLMLAADSAGVITAGCFAAALGLLGLWQFVVGDNTYLRIRVWMDRYLGLVSAAIIAAAAVAALSFSILPGILERIGALTWPSGVGKPDYLRGLEFYLPGLVLYEFLIVVLGVAGAVLVVTWRIRSRLAVWCLAWTVLSFAAYLLMPMRAPDFTLALIVPVAFLGAFAVDYAHHTNAWRYIRYVVATLVALTIYMQLLTTFVYFAPDASEAPWRRHASLYWGDGAATTQLRAQSAEILKLISAADATVAFNGAAGSSALIHWYLRVLRPAAVAESATVAVSVGASATAGTSADHSYAFDFEESWQPRITTLDAARGIRYLLAARVWGPVTTRGVAITVRPGGGSAPTVILTPDE